MRWRVVLPRRNRLARQAQGGPQYDVTQGPMSLSEVVTTPMNYSMPRSLEWIADELGSLQKEGLRRHAVPRSGPSGAWVEVEGRRLACFASNDYLALAADPRLGAAAALTASQEGWGSAASPLVFGQSTMHVRLQERLAEFEGTEAALLFSTGFAANAGTIAALVGPGDVVYSDRKNHASLLDGCRLCARTCVSTPTATPATWSGS